MKFKAYALICALALFATAPVYAQDHGHHYGRGHGKGNPHTDKQGHNNNGSDKNGDDGDDFDGDHDYSVLQTRMGEVVSSLSIGTLTTPDGAPIPISAQGKLYVVLTNSIVSAENPPAAGTMVSTVAESAVDSPDANAPSISRFVLALSASGTGAQSKLTTLTRDLSGMAYDPKRVPRAVISFNDFVKSASSEFLANPTPEFIALHTILQKLTAGFEKK
ncbi:MAG TPA: hypothetical protein VJS39_07100 [Gemmatimonadaceae bacterium]|nr:hypothetical protein [Gemmatimonadaceae bacterium]